MYKANNTLLLRRIEYNLINYSNYLINDRVLDKKRLLEAN